MSIPITLAMTFGMIYLAGIIRLRPVTITVGAMVLALFPLALHGGPLCYALIGGLITVATFIRLLMVPVSYSITVLDLKWLTGDEHVKEVHEKMSASGALMGRTDLDFRYLAEVRIDM